MEEIGIGRPSTYASILGVLRDRDYVRMEAKRVRAGGSRPAGDGVPDQLLRALRRSAVHRRARGAARRHLRRPRRLARGDDASFWDAFQPRRGADPRAQDLRRHRCARRRPGAALLPRARRRRRPAALHRLRHRPARPEARPLRQLHRLLELPGLPVHAAAGGRCQGRRGRRDAEGRRPPAGHASRDIGGDHRQARAVGALRAAGRARPRWTRRPSRGAPPCRAASRATA